MGVDAREPQSSVNTATDLSNCTIVSEITPGMILQDLAMGLDKNAISKKYAYVDASGETQPFELWMVNEMFKDPLLKGKRPSKVKVLPFRFKASSDEVQILDIETVNNQVKTDLQDAGYTTSDNDVAEGSDNGIDIDNL